jgi:hypothetical protein
VPGADVPGAFAPKLGRGEVKVTRSHMEADEDGVMKLALAGRFQRGGLSGDCSRVEADGAAQRFSLLNLRAIRYKKRSVTIPHSRPPKRVNLLDPA